MKIRFIHHYKGFNIHESDCVIHILNNLDDFSCFVLFEDIGTGTSVTNSSEQLATEITKEYKLDPKTCRFFETYQQYDYDSFDEIKYTWKDGVASNPEWKPASDFKKLFLK